MTNNIIQDLYQVVNQHKNKNEVIAALKAIQAALEHELYVEATEASTAMFMKQLSGQGNND